MLAKPAAADTDDLLDRVTAYRAGMEPEAIDLIEMELQRRGVTEDEIALHAANTGLSARPDGNVLMCSRCRKPAVTDGWGWHRIWGPVPVFPRRYRYCADHRPSKSRPITGREEDDA